MKIIRYTLTLDGKIPNGVIDGGYFIKYNSDESPKDYDMIGLSSEWIGLEEYTTKLLFENYIKSFISDSVDPVTNKITLVQDLIDSFWNKSII
tara:strand:- start:141 stop:419 length:279 start_codon:yes stop_codon:yes gene_type:complete